jgi:hypothetical protein
MMIPLLYFAQGDYSLEDEDFYSHRNDIADMATKGVGPNVLNRWTHGDLVSIRMLGVQHAAFDAQWQRNDDYWKYYADLQPGDYGREDAIVGYAWVARYTRAFLDAYLKHDASAMAFLQNKPVENGVPKHVMSVKYRPASGVALSFDGFRIEIGRQGFEHADDIYAAFQKRDRNFKLDEGAMIDWAEQLISKDYLPEALVVLDLKVKMHPESPYSYEILGDVHATMGQKSLAIDSYKLVYARG